MALMVVLLLVLLVSACQPVTMPQEVSAEGEGQDALTPVSIGVGYIPSVQFATMYVAIEKGFFAEEGLDVSLEYGFENDYLKLVGVGERQFMIGSGDQVIIGRAQGLPVRYVMNWYTRYPVVVFAKEAVAITEPADLAGKRIGLPGPFGATYVAFRGILEAAGLEESDVQMESIGFTQAAAVSEGSVDAAVDYAASGPVVLEQAGEAITTIGLDDYLTMPSNGLVTNETTLQNDAELVRRLVRGSLRGVEYTLANPDEAFATALSFIPEAGGENEAINRAIFDATLPYWQLDTGSQPGATDLADWEIATEFMQRIDLVESAPPAAELFSNDYLP
ncbi:MAG: ABC transporter substrate-binding protein [Caldilineaceae bacterium]|nr:ABC transporter substrate-binding protein [Caldilineaceae bacterium]